MSLQLCIVCTVRTTTGIDWRRTIKRMKNQQGSIFIFRVKTIAVNPFVLHYSSLNAKQI